MGGNDQPAGMMGLMNQRGNTNTVAPRASAMGGGAQPSQMAMGGVGGGSQMMPMNNMGMMQPMGGVGGQPNPMNMTFNLSNTEGMPMGA